MIGRAALILVSCFDVFEHHSRLLNHGIHIAPEYEVDRVVSLSMQSHN